MGYISFTHIPSNTDDFVSGVARSLARSFIRNVVAQSTRLSAPGARQADNLAVLLFLGYSAAVRRRTPRVLHALKPPYAKRDPHPLPPPSSTFPLSLSPPPSSPSFRLSRWFLLVLRQPGYDRQVAVCKPHHRNGFVSTLGFDFYASFARSSRRRAPSSLSSPPLCPRTFLARSL